MAGKIKSPLAIMFVRVLAIAAVVGLLLLACSNPTSSSKHCPDEDYPLWCEDNSACCPQGYPINCGGKCYQTTDDASANCDARIDTCYRE